VTAAVPVDVIPAEAEPAADPDERAALGSLRVGALVLALAAAILIAAILVPLRRARMDREAIDTGQAGTERVQSAAKWEVPAGKPTTNSEPAAAIEAPVEAPVVPGIKAASDPSGDPSAAPTGRLDIEPDELAPPADSPAIDLAAPPTPTRRRTDTGRRATR
jgi:hypothetical protein